jgi:hypothetical protein
MVGSWLPLTDAASLVPLGYFVYGIATEACKRRLSKCQRNMVGAARLNSYFPPDERRLAIASSYDVFVFDLAEGRKIKKYHPGKYVRLFFSESQLAFTSEHMGLISFDMDTGKEMRRFEKEIDGYHHWHNCAEFLIYRKLGASRSGQSDDPVSCHVRVYSQLTGELMSEFTEPNPWIHFWAVSHDGQAILGQGNVPIAPGQDQMSYEFVANAVTGVRRGSQHSGRWVQWLALSPDGKCIAKCGVTQRPEWVEKWRPRKTTIDVTN